MKKAICIALAALSLSGCIIQQPVKTVAVPAPTSTPSYDPLTGPGFCEVTAVNEARSVWVDNLKMMGLKYDDALFQTVRPEFIKWCHDGINSRLNAEEDNSLSEMRSVLNEQKAAIKNPNIRKGDMIALTAKYLLWQSFNLGFHGINNY